MVVSQFVSRHYHALLVSNPYYRNADQPASVLERHENGFASAPAQVLHLPKQVSALYGQQQAG
ncbi:MAG: hypothetical protein E6J04_06460 [Chloroflexi bacterium]|nr:MAG: hypothetical protein E6J04_06460 [Chloroflexota bacterium]